MGFWGLSKVIERHDLTPELSVDRRKYLFQAESTTLRSELNLSGAGLVAASERVDRKDFDSVVNSVSNALGVNPLKPIDWDNWEEMVINNHPCLLVALPHNDGMDALEINNEKRLRIRIHGTHVKPEDARDFPIVALLGCDTTGTAMNYSNFVQHFRDMGAGVVIGTVATVFGEHAARVGGMLVEGLKDRSDKHERLGEIMRSIKRKALAEGLLMALCVVAFGDADWKLTKNK
jgi:hypothetical protein